MNSTALNNEQVLDLLERLTDMQELPRAVEQMGVDHEAALEVAVENGYPSWNRMYAAHKVLKREAAARAQVDGVTVIGDHSTHTGQPQPGTDGSRLVLMPLHLLAPDPDNLRFDDTEDVEDLAQSIRMSGLQQPIVARQSADVVDVDHPAVIVAGHRRYAALTLLGHRAAQVILRPEMDADDVLAAMLVENSQRRDLDPISEARGINHLMTTRADLNSQYDVAQQLGRSQTWVGRRLALLKLSPAVQDKVRAGEILEAEAVALSRRNSGDARPAQAGSNSHHLGASHDLASRAKRRCQSNNHTGRKVGLVACGECWEAVIRADERALVHTHSAQKGECVTCGRSMS